MDSEIRLAFALALLSTLGICLAALPLVLAARGRIAVRVGPVLASERGARAWQRLALTGGAVATALVIVQWNELPGALALLVLVLSAGLLAASPLSQDADVGERGVRRGWSAREFAQLEEWRLTGEHLRWRLRGEWHACRVSSEQHAALRARLQAACADRESPFRD